MPREMVEGGGGRRGAGAFFRGGCGSGGVILVFTRTPGESYRKRLRVFVVVFVWRLSSANLRRCLLISRMHREEWG